MDIPGMISVGTAAARTSKIFCIGALFGLVPAFGLTAEAGTVRHAS